MNFKTLVFLLLTTWVTAQDKNLQELTYNEYLGFVKKYHSKTANIFHF
jgi:hypothetical protein